MGKKKNNKKHSKKQHQTVKSTIKVSDNKSDKLFQRLMNKKGVQRFIKVVKIPAVGFSILAIILNYVLEVLSRHSFVKPFYFIMESPMVFLYNAFIIFVTLSLVLFAKRKIFATIFVCAMWIISAFANWIVLCFRTTPFSAIDILMIRNVLTMLDKYMTKWQMLLSAIGIILVVLLLVYLYIKLPKSKSKRRPFRASAYVCMCLFMVYTLTKVAVDTNTVSDNFGNLAYAYNDYGFAYCFSNSIIDVGISRPKNYSGQAVRDITDGLHYNKDDVVFVTKEENEDSIATESAISENKDTTTGNVNGGADDITDENIDRQQETDQEDSDVQAEEAGDSTKMSGSYVKEQEGNTVEAASTEKDGNTVEAASTEKDEDTVEAASTEKDEDTVEAASTENDGNKVEGASKEKDKSATEDNSEEEDDKYYKNEPATKKYPNIIVIQLESIFDTKYMKDLRVTERVMPTLANLKERYSTGLFTVPAVGAGTANTEFEVQTGMSTQFFGAGEYPFKTIMKSQTCDSMAYDLKRYGYATAGFHNNDATFYERYIDYSNLGFDVFTAMEHMYFLQYTPRGWAKDNILDNEMIERMRQTEGRDYITTITVQAHGRYPKKHTDTLTHIGCYFTGEYEGDTAKEAAWEYYINQCRETDNMIKDLIAGLEKLDEPTVVFMYGDHLPSLNLQESDLRNINLYQTEWVMWDNIGLKRQYKELKSYQASTYIFDRLRIDGGLMQHFHSKYMYQADQEDYLNKLEMLEYDTLYGEDYAFDGHNPFPQTDMKLGIRDIVVEGIEESAFGKYVKGKGFNAFSEVWVDGKAVETTYLNYQTLMIPKDALDNAKEICVVQVGDDHIPLSFTEKYSLIQSEDSSEDMTIENSSAEDTTTENTTTGNSGAENTTTGNSGAENTTAEDTTTGNSGAENTTDENTITGSSTTGN